MIEIRASGQYLDIISELEEKGADGVIAGCTEIPLLINGEDCQIPFIDSAYEHVRAAVNHAIQ